MDCFQTEDLSEFAVLTCHLFLWSLSDLCQTFYHNSGFGQQTSRRYRQNGDVTVLGFEAEGSYESDRVRGSNAKRHEVVK